MSPPAAAAAVVDVTASSTVPQAIAAVEPFRLQKPARRILTVCLRRGKRLQSLAPELQLLTPQIQHALQLCRRTIIIRLDENGNASM